MPPSSRKRNKGKDRKAKQQAKKEENVRADLHRFWRRLCLSMECNHGCGMMISDDHPVSSFMDQFFVNSKHKRMTVSQTLKDLFETHPQIWKDKSLRQLALGMLTRFGTNMILDANYNLGWPLCIAQCIVVLEQYNGTDDIDLAMNERVVRTKWRSVCNMRDCLKFYRKRVSCKCPKTMHLWSRKKIPKTGICWNCHKEKERVALSVCSRCMITPYCSRGCQVADWTNHKKSCDDYVRAQNNE